MANICVIFAFDVKYCFRFEIGGQISCLEPNFGQIGIQKFQRKEESQAKDDVITS